MTGYGRVEFTAGEDAFTVEVKTLNNRYIDINLRIPERFSQLESRIREEVKRRFSRGSFTVYVTYSSGEAFGQTLNMDVAKTYLEAARTLKTKLGVTGDADVEFLLRLKDIFTADKKTPDADADWTALQKGLGAALDQVDEWRGREGEALKIDFLARLKNLEGHLKVVEDAAPDINSRCVKKMKEAIERLIGQRVDESRLLMEAAICAEKSDVTEEIVRLKSHLNTFGVYLNLPEPAGKRLDFLCQEIGREINTIGSKAADVSVTRTVIEMKNELEKMREQSQNVE